MRPLGGVGLAGRQSGEPVSAARRLALGVRSYRVYSFMITYILMIVLSTRKIFCLSRRRSLPGFRARSNMVRLHSSPHFRSLYAPSQHAP